MNLMRLKAKKVLAFATTKRTLWVDDDTGSWDDDRPDSIRRTLRKGTKLIIMEATLDDYEDSGELLRYPYAAFNIKGEMVIGFESEEDALSMDFLDYGKEGK